MSAATKRFNSADQCAPRMGIKVIALGHVSGEPCEIGSESRYRSRPAGEAEEETDAFIRSPGDRPRARPSADALYEVKGPGLCALGDIAKTLRLAAS